jgi:hypothetical protein
MVSACLFLAGRLVIGSGEAEVRPLAQPMGVATINECRLTGRVEGRTNGVFAVFDLENPTREEKEITLHFLASCTPAMSFESRMGPMPEVVKMGILECRVKAGRLTQAVLLRDPAPASQVAAKAGGALVPPGTNVAANVLFSRALSPEMWSLVVSREAITGVHGWGAVEPAASDATISLDKGEAVLANTVLEKPKK